MHDVNHALAVLGEKLKLPDLKLNENGQSEIAFGDGLSIYITEIDRRTAEMSFRLRDLDFADAAMMRAMLEANCLGSGTGGGRLALDPANGQAIYCERWDVAAMEAGAVEERFTTLMQYGAFWMTEGAAALMSEAERIEAETEADDENVAEEADEHMLIRA